MDEKNYLLFFLFFSSDVTDFSQLSLRFASIFAPFLTLFKKFQWQSDENHLQDRSLHWDHALLLTGLDLESKTKDGKVSNKIVGLAPVSGMCDPKTSCTVSEGNHFESVFVIAHEFGHNLGMKHDGRTGENLFFQK